MKILARGAEAIISYDGKNVLKERIAKNYRIIEIDEKLRKTRTKREAKVLQKMHTLGIPVPEIKAIDEKGMTLTMNFIQGKTLKETLHENPEKYSYEIGKKIGTFHANNIIHGDLTTSNMILNNEINFIDFGLSFFSQKIEDKAVDLHVLRQALESKHHDLWEKAFVKVLEGYKENNPEAEQVILQLNKVEKRGRNKK